MAIASTSSVTSQSAIVNSKNDNKMNNKNNNNNKVVLEITTDTTSTDLKESKVRNNKIVDEVVHDVEEEVNSTLEKLFRSLDGTYLLTHSFIRSLLLTHSFHSGIKFDSLLLLVVTSMVIPICKSLNTSPILGFLLMGTVLGPNGLRWMKDLHMIDIMGELGTHLYVFTHSFTHYLGQVLCFFYLKLD